MKNINLQLYLELDFMVGKLRRSQVHKSFPYYNRKLNLLSNLLNFNRRINLPIASQLRNDI
jgi:hypothetical protein